MKIIFLRHDEINKAKWDFCIANATNGLIYAYSWYLDIICEKWDALVDDDYRSVMPIPNKNKFNISYIYPPFFAQQLGLFSTEHVSRKLTSRFIEAIPSKFRFIEMYMNKSNAINNAKYLISTNKSCELDLQNSYQQINLGFSTNTRRNIKKAVNHQLQIRMDSPPEDIIELFRNNRGKDISVLGAKDYERLHELIKVLAAKNKVDIWSAFDHNNSLCAGVFFANDQNRSYFLFSGRNEVAKENGAMFLIIDQYISENAGKNRILDFVGSNDPNLARFYNGFGSTEEEYYKLKINKLPGIYKLLKK
jgi:hypothetical protein